MAVVLAVIRYYILSCSQRSSHTFIKEMRSVCLKKQQESKLKHPLSIILQLQLFDDGVSTVVIMDCIRLFL